MGNGPKQKKLADNKKDILGQVAVFNYIKQGRPGVFDDNILVKDPDEGANEFEDSDSDAPPGQVKKRRGSKKTFCMLKGEADIKARNMFGELVEDTGLAIKKLRKNLRDCVPLK